MSMIRVTDLTFAYPGSYDNIFEHASFQFGTDWKLGFTGRNGRSKTTFLRLLAGELPHGGAIAGMFDAAFGVVANFTAGENEATTTDMTVSFLRGVEYGMELYLKVYIVKAGRSLIRQRAELTDAATGKLLATASGSWMSL